MSADAAAPAASTAAVDCDSAPPSLGPRSLAWLRATLRLVDGVCFDVDSTVSVDEGIDVLAECMGKAEAVKQLTAQAMNGSVLFQDALRMRLELLRPSRSDIARCLSERPPCFTPGFESFAAWLRSEAGPNGNGPLPIYLISGGFRPMIEPLRKTLNLPVDSVFANQLLFDDDGCYAGFDESEPTSRSGGKGAALQHLINARGHRRLLMIGDGVTDLEACPPAVCMIGFGGVVRRPAVEAQANAFVTEWRQLREMWSGEEERSNKVQETEQQKQR